MSATARRGWAGTGSTPQWRRLRLQILARDNWTCQIAGPRCTQDATTVDHITALADGGSKYDQRNLRAACERCNYGRRDSPPANTRAITVEARTRW